MPVGMVVAAGGRVMVLDEERRLVVEVGLYRRMDRSAEPVRM